MTSSTAEPSLSASSAERVAENARSRFGIRLSRRARRLLVDAHRAADLGESAV